MRVLDFRLGVGLALALTSLALNGSAKTPSTSRRQSARPADAKPDALAGRLCDAFHALPARRKAECCGTNPGSLASECAKELSVSLRSGAVTVDAAGIDRCAAETVRRLEGCGWVTPLLPKLPDACSGIIHGTRKVGAACRSSLECVDGLYCKGLGPTSAGRCSAPAAAGAQCEAPADRLAAFTRAKDDPRHPECRGRCLKGRCLPATPAGQACVSSSVCAPGLNCIAGRCEARPLPKVGEPCAGKTVCEAGAFCQAGRCVALKDRGEPCTSPFECRAFECAKAPRAIAGTCGDPCMVGAGVGGARTP